MSGNRKWDELGFGLTMGGNGNVIDSTGMDGNWNNKNHFHINTCFIAI